MELPPHLLDKEIRKAASLAREAREDQRRGAPERLSRKSPLEDLRLVSSRSTYLELGEKPGDPLVTGIRAWVYALTLERVLWPDAARLSAAWHEASIFLEAPEPAQLSPRVLLGRVLTDSVRDRRRAWAEALSRGGHRVAEAARILAERRAEAVKRLDEGVSADSIEIPCNPPGAAETTAERLLELTAPMSDLEGDRWDDAIDRSMAREATSGWPARLSARWVEEQLRPTRLTEGLAIDLGRLPEPLGASSFVRTLAQFGRAFAAASVPEAAPFSLARPPFDLRAERRAALFGALLADPMFGMWALGLGRDRARAQAREVARAGLLSLRLDAARVKLRGALLLPETERKGRLEAETARALGVPVPGALAGVFPKLDPGDPVRLLGSVLAALDRRELIERFDEDWFRNPRAALALREEQSVLPAATHVSEKALDEGLGELVRSLERVIT